MILNTRMVVGAGVVALVAAGGARADEAAVAKLREAQAALQKITTVRYTMEVRPGGAIEGQAPSIDGTLLMQAAPGMPIPIRLAGEGTISQPGAAEATRFSAAFDGDTIRSLDYALGVLQSSPIAPGADTLLVGAYDLVLDMFMVDEPLKAEIEAEDVTLEGQAEVAGATTDVLLVTYDSGSNIGKTRLYLSTEDHLPRRVDSLFTVGGKEAIISYTLTSVEANPTVGADAFMLTAPEGFVTSEFDINSMGLLPTNIDAPAWTLTDRDGKTVHLSDFAGKVVVMDFWATWCAPCKAAMPIIQRLHANYADKGLVVLGINTDEADSDAAMQYIDDKGYTYRQLLNGEALSADYRIQGLPVLYLIGRDGTIAFRELGMDEDALTEAIEQALAAGGS
jgi:thiol-disulfide isomerase/thioredoxin